jgi:alpha-galactosidase
MMPKLVIVGAGSAVFTQGLVMDLIATQRGEPWELGLVDTNAEALQIVTSLVQKMIDGREAPIALSGSTDRTEILPGADFVVSTIGVGGRRAWEADVFIPREYGVYQPVGDTVMPGGISRAMRMIPALVDIANDIQAICPDAWFFNYANPMAANCTAIRCATQVSVIGLCHGVHDSLRALASELDVPLDHLSACAVGINHLTFVYELRADGHDLLPALREKITERRIRGIDPERIGALAWKDGGEELNPFSWSLFETLGAYPVPGDRHVTEFYADVFPGGDYYDRRLGVDAFPFEPVIEGGDRKYEEMTRLARSPEPLDEAFFGRFSGEHEQLLSIIDSIRTDARRTYSVNMPNGGAYSNLPADAVLELPAVASADGFLALPFDTFPDTIAPAIRRHLDIIGLTVEAALAGDRHLMVEAILAGGYLRERAAVEAMTDELLAAHAEYLPQFE